MLKFLQAVVRFFQGRCTRCGALAWSDYRILPRGSANTAGMWSGEAARLPRGSVSEFPHRVHGPHPVGRPGRCRVAGGGLPVVKALAIRGLVRFLELVIAWHGALVAAPKGAAMKLLPWLPDQMQTLRGTAHDLSVARAINRGRDEISLCGLRPAGARLVPRGRSRRRFQPRTRCRGNCEVNCEVARAKSWRFETLMISREGQL